MASLKSTIAAAALIIAGSASAATPHGTGRLSFSQEALQAMDASGVFILTEGVGNKANYDGIANIDVALTTGTTAGDMVTSLKSVGSHVDIERTVLKGKIVWVDNIITLSDFVLDLGTKTLSADLKGTNLVSGVVTNYGFNPIFSAAGIEGGQLGASGWTSITTTGPLNINLATADKFLTILGLPLTDGVADLVKNANWGVATAVVAVPEPSSLFLGALGGIGLFGVARLRKQKLV